MASRSRAERRAHAERIKARTRRVMRRWFARLPLAPDPRDLGVAASTHCRPCACWMCQAPRKDVPPPRERPFLHS